MNTCAILRPARSRAKIKLFSLPVDEWEFLLADGRIASFANDVLIVFHISPETALSKLTVVELISKPVHRR
ncbi:MAG TPA: hypothetical protein VK308_14565 [Pyrinomonadaceae bacterium]|nr:hypothetical protein [Pyrinomonadaceae bacterium]